MSDREARIRLRLIAGSYLGGLQQVSQQTQAVMSTMSAHAARAGAAGLASVKSTLGGMGTMLTSNLASAAKLGGVFGVGAAAKKGLELQQTYKNLAFNISQATGEAVSWTSVQRTIESAADKTGRTSGEMADAFDRVWKSTGDAKYAADALVPIGTAATASGKGVDKLGDAAALLKRKWGMTIDTLPDGLARMFEKMDAGGAGFDDLGAKFGSMAGEAAASGMKGAAGLSLMLGMMQQLDDRVGEKATSGMKTFFQTFRDGSSQLKRLEKEGGVKFGPDDDAMGKMRKMLQSGKARAAAELTFTGDAGAVFGELAKPFDEAFAAAKQAGATTKEATSAGLKAFDESLKKMGDSNATWAKVQEQAADRAEDPQRKLAKAMEQFAVEFTKPEALEAMGQLANTLPKVAQGLAKLANFAINNPLGAAGAYVATKVALSFASGALASAGGAIGTAAAARIKAAAAATGPWKAAGAALAIAAAAWLALEFGKGAIDKEADKQRGEVSDLVGARAAAEALAVQPNASAESKAAAAKTLRERIEASDAESAKRKGGMLNKVTFGAWSDVSDTFAGKDDEMAKSRAALRDLESQLSKTGEGGEKAGRGLDDLQRAAGKAAAALNALNGGPGAPTGGNATGSHGLPPAASGVPGFAGGR